ncbi:Non-histone chromosomal protein 6 [Mortierella claussenii]|nr:Non-histone chromosomal protein 6 [Mortierella claussenii]
MPKIQKETKVSSRVGKKAAKDPNEPKRPATAFNLFSREKREDVKIDHPGANAAKLSKILGSLWRDLSEDEKSKYTNQQKMAMTAYRIEKETYDERKASPTTGLSNKAPKGKAVTKGKVATRATKEAEVKPASKKTSIKSIASASTRISANKTKPKGKKTKDSEVEDEEEGEVEEEEEVMEIEEDDNDFV